MPDERRRTDEPGNTRRTDETNTGDPRAVRPMDDVGMASGSVNDVPGAADTPLTANEAGAEVERRGIARDPMDEHQGGESHG